MPTVKELKEHLNTYGDDDVIAWDIWSPEDVIWAGKQDRKVVSQEHAKAVIEEVHRHKDASLGISWDTLRCYLDETDLPDIPEDCPSPDDSYCGDCKKCKPKEGDKN
jgi:hypothetical protein